MNRRAFILLLAGTAACPLALRRASAQEAGRAYRLAFLLPTDRQSPPVLALPAASTWAVRRLPNGRRWWSGARPT